MIRPIERKFLTKTILSLLVFFCCVYSTLNRSFLYVNAVSATGTITTAYDQQYNADWQQSGYFMCYRYITINLNDYASGHALISVEANEGFSILCENATVTEPANRTIRVDFTHEKYIFIVLFSRVYAPDVTNWSLTATLDNDNLTEVIANQEIIIQDFADFMLEFSDLTTFFDDFNSMYKSYNTPIMNYIKYIENQGQSGTGVSSYEYTNSEYNSNSYSYKNNNGRSIKRIEVQYKNNIQYSGNYVVFQYLFYCTSIQSQDVFKNLQIRNREQSSTKLITINDAIVYLTRTDFQNDNSCILYLTLYIPIISYSEYNNNEYRIDILNFTLTDVIRAKFTFLGIVENLPETEPYNSNNSTANSIDDITSDLNDQINQSNSATSSTEAILNNFNQNLDLSDYNFNISTGDSVNYFKQKLTNIYEINEFKPFYLIPVILFVLGRILAG